MLGTRLRVSSICYPLNISSSRSGLEVGIRLQDHKDCQRAVSRRSMVAIYVLKLARGKYYVGMTKRNIDRVLDHIDGKGAVWTKKSPPSKSKPIISFQENLRASDEDRITLATMKKYGIQNVRGGSYCQIRLSAGTIASIEEKLAPKRPKKKSKSPQARTRSSTTKKKTKPKCSRCGRTSHNASKCYAKTYENGKKIPAKAASKGKGKAKCSRCGRNSHTVKTCNANHHDNGKRLPDKTKARNR